MENTKIVKYYILRVMTLKQLLQPDLILESTILDLTPDIVKEYQLRGLILDVDETLVPLNVSQASAELRYWVEQMRTFVSLWLVSNNLSESRIRGIAEFLDLPYYLGAAKPSRRKIREAILSMGLPVEQVGMVGDRLFTDVLAGNRLGMFTILLNLLSNLVLNSMLILFVTLKFWITEILGAPISSRK
ncbi:Hydrolase, HAD subfamily IIIA [Richelia intracellularis HM01]|nr:Hydrolase, HAD subfamily IIIA [Richelia intracellularis HM01]